MSKKAQTITEKAQATCKHTLKADILKHSCQDKLNIQDTDQTFSSEKDTCPENCPCKQADINTIRLENPLKVPKYARDTRHHPLRFPIPKVKSQNDFQSEEKSDLEILTESCKAYDIGPKRG